MRRAQVQPLHQLHVLARIAGLTALLGCIGWVCWAWLPAAAAQAAQSVKLTATLTPEHLGQGTTIGFSFQIEAPARRRSRRR